MPGSSTFAIKPLRIFDQDRRGLLRLTPFASRLTGSAPTVFDGPGCLQQPGPKVLTERPGASLVRLPNPYWVARLAWSTLTPGPMVLETETFLK